MLAAISPPEPPARQLGSVLTGGSSAQHALGWVSQCLESDPGPRQEEYNKNTVFQELLNKEESMLLASGIQRYNSVCRFSSLSEATLFVHASLKWKVFPLPCSFQRKI